MQFTVQNFSGINVTVSGIPVIQADSNVNTGQLTGIFYPLNSNPAGYVTSTAGGTSVQVSGSSPFLTGANLVGISGITLLLSGNSIFINGGGVTGQGGTGIGGSGTNVQITGSSNLSIANFTGISGINLIISGNNVLINSNSLQNQINSINNNTGNFVTSMQTGILTGSFTLNSNTGNFITNSQTGSFASLVNLASTGSTLQTEINNINSSTGNFITSSQTGRFSILTGVNYYSGNSFSVGNDIISGNVSGYIFSGTNFIINGNTVVTNNQTGIFITTGQTGNFAVLSASNTFSNINNFNGMVTFGSAGINFQDSSIISSSVLIDSSDQNSINWTNRTLINTGNSVTLDWQNKILSGLWNASGLQVLGNNVITSNQTGMFVTTGQTGSFGGGSTPTGQLTGAFYPLNSNPSGYLNSNSLTGSYIFNTNISSGLNQQFISFPTNLGNNPYVIPSLANISGSEKIDVWASGITGSGYWAQFTNTIDSSSYVLTTIASISNITGFSTNVININYINTGVFNTGIFNTGVFYTGIFTGTFVQITGSSFLTGTNLSGIGGIKLIQSGNNTLISGSSSNITIPTWSYLTFGTTTTWSATPNVIEDKQILILTGATTLSITNLYNGWGGTLLAIQSGTGPYNITLPGGTKVINGGGGQITLTTGVSGAIDFIGFEYNGINLFAGIGNNYN